MPTQKNLGVSPLENETPTAKALDTLAGEAKGRGKRNLSDMPTHTNGEMTKSEALAVAWTGIEALAQMKQAIIYRSKTGGKIYVMFLETNLSSNGLEQA